MANPQSGSPCLRRWWRSRVFGFGAAGLLLVGWAWGGTWSETAYVSVQTSSGTHIWFSGHGALESVWIDPRHPAVWRASLGGRALSGPCGPVVFGPETIYLSGLLPPPGQAVASGWTGPKPSGMFSESTAGLRWLGHFPYAGVSLVYAGVWLGFLRWWQGRKRRLDHATLTT